MAAAHRVSGAIIPENAAAFSGWGDRVPWQWLTPIGRIRPIYGRDRHERARVAMPSHSRERL